MKTSIPRITLGIHWAHLTALSGLLLGGLGSGCGEPRPVPLLGCAEPSVDFGQTWEGTILRHTFELEVGNVPMRILDTETDCGCTLTRIKEADGSVYQLGDELQPETSLWMDVEVNTRSKRGRAPRNVRLVAQASRSGSAQDSTGDSPRESAGEPERLPFTVWSDIRPWLVADPNPLGTLSTIEGEPAEASFRVRQADGLAFPLAPSRKGLPPWVHVTATPGTEAATEHRVDVRFDESAPRGVRGYGVLLETDVVNPDGPRTAEGEPVCFSLLHGVSIDVRGPVALRPPSLTFGVIRPGQIVARTVRLESHDPAFEMPEPRVLLEPLKRDEPFYLTDCTSIRTRPAGKNAWDVEVTLSELDSRIQGNFFARLVVETGHPKLPKLEASLMGVAVGTTRIGGGR